MTTLPPKTDTTAEAVYAGIVATHTEEPRAHLGASIIGHHCTRYVWLSFRWAFVEKFEGRLLRLFRRGHSEEAHVVFDLQNAGMVVDDHDKETGRQFQFADGHFAGSTDGIIRSGVPDAPKKPHVLEIKTHSLKSFTAVKKDGVQKSKPQHYAQMQVYMRKLGIDRALYFAVCKDNDQIHTERVKLDAEYADELIGKAQWIIRQDRMPEPISADPTWYQCSYCPARRLCHEKKPTDQVNCRTCAKSTALPDGTWHCAHYDAVVPLKHTRTGCDAHVIHPDLVPWQFQPTEDGLTLIYTIDGKQVLNGDPAAGAVSSWQLLGMMQNAA
jgi:hypothetical protein